MFVGEIAINRETFLYDLRLWELRAIHRGYIRRHSDVLNMLRNLGYWILAALGGKDFTNRTTITDLIRFPWDAPEEVESLTDDEVEELRDLIRQENERLSNTN